MKFSEFYNLNKQQASLDFVDIPLDTDLAVFLDPTSIKHMDTPWGHKLKSSLHSFFQEVLSLINLKKHSEAKKLLASLKEGNEFHLGFSKGKSQGHAFGSSSAESVWDALTKSKAYQSGLLKDLEDTALLIHGIGKDMISDAVCNIIRAHLIEYTQAMCVFYNIPMEKSVNSGSLWSSEKKKWSNKLVDLPVAGSFGRVILVPKVLVRHALSYRHQNYYSQYLLPEMAAHEIKQGSALVEMLKSGPRVTKKSLKKQYGKNKESIVDQTVLHPHALDKFRADKIENPESILEHEDFSVIQNTNEIVDWNGMKARLTAISPGKKGASDYENIILDIFTALFYPSLCNPLREDKIHNGRKRIDITYTNEANTGFFNWLSNHYPSAIIPVECKNYSKEINNPELDQLSSRFSIKRGKVGILAYRSSSKKEDIEKRCIDTANDDRGYIIALDDSDIIALIDQRIENSNHHFELLRIKFNKIIK
jgi:hypothetical protein